MAIELGYYFHENEYPHLPGYTQLDVNVYEEPTHKHFDPEQVTFPTIEGSGEVSDVAITHPWRGPNQFQVTAGRIYITSFDDKVVQGYALGGSLSITAHDNYTTCSLTSEAPIFELNAGDDTATILVSEFEALLAKKLSQRTGDELEFQKKLAAIEPFTLFVAGLVAIEQHLRRMPQTGSQQQALSVVVEAIDTLKTNSRWPSSVPKLDELL